MPKRLITALAGRAGAPRSRPRRPRPDPTADARRPRRTTRPTAVKEIYSDYRNDGKIDVCTHERADLQDALDTIEPDFDTDNPDFRAALEAGIQRHDDGRCADATTATATATATATPTATATATATADSGSAATDDRRRLRRRRRRRDPAARRRHAPARGRTLPPEDAGARAPAPPAAGADRRARRPRPSRRRRARRRRSSRRPRNGSLLLPGILLGLALLCGRRSPLFPLAAAATRECDAAWQEAASAPAATWADFTDWLRLGR